MTNSEILSRKLNRAGVLIEQARQLVQFVIDADEAGDGVSAGKFDKTCDDLLDLIDDLGYEIIMPMEMAEEE